jgi:hypothetical protein
MSSGQSGLAQDGLEEINIKLIHGALKDREVGKALFLNSDEEEEVANMVELLAGVVRSLLLLHIFFFVFLSSFSPLCSHNLFLGRRERMSGRRS